jgi:hypothetical protein
MDLPRLDCARCYGIRASKELALPITLGAAYRSLLTTGLNYPSIPWSTSFEFRLSKRLQYAWSVWLIHRANDI